MKVHLRGFGVIGCASAWALAARDVQFTWSDTDSSVTAWRACTGAVYPSASGRDVAGYRGWSAWVASPPWEFGDVMEMADYWYCTKSLPHGFKGRPTAQVGSLKLHPQPSYHFNAQRFVEVSRTLFADARRAPTADAEVVISHGFNDRLQRYVWGWMRLASVDQTALGSRLRRACVYLRSGRVVMAYAYPSPGTPYWYAGSTLLVQKTPAARSPEPDLARWEKRWHDLSGGQLPVRWQGPIVQGWRPSTGPVDGEDAQPLWERRDGVLTVMPLWHSGVRWLPLVVEELLTGLNI